MSFHHIIYDFVYGVNRLYIAAGIAGFAFLILLFGIYKYTKIPEKILGVPKRLIRKISAIRAPGSRSSGRKPLVRRRNIGLFLFFTIVTAISVAILWVSWQLAGPLDTIIYVLLFLFGLLGIPTFIVLGFVPSILGMKNAVGKLHAVMGQLTYGHGWLIQIGKNRLEWVPGTEDAFWMDGEWYRGVEDSVRNQTVLGWMPFTMAYFKDEDALKEYRVDALNEAKGNITTADGGTVERAGYSEVPIPGDISGIDGDWLLDVKRLYGQGLERVGNMSIIERTEQIEMQKEAKKSKLAGWSPIIGTIAGLIIGLMTGHVLVG